VQHKYIYGPVPSRRLGFSLGIDLVPFKLCSFDCIYCQLGATTRQTLERREYSPTDTILNDVKTVLRKGNHIDYLTFSGSGEPTLHSKIGYLIKEVKKITQIPVAVLTNGSLLYKSSVQRDLLSADVVLPTLCASSERIFKKINRAHRAITIEKVIRGLIKFRKMYKGKIWLELMFVKGINDTSQEIIALKDIINKIGPDKIHLNTVIRPPSEKYASRLSIEELKRVKAILGDRAEIVAETDTKRVSAQCEDIEKMIFDIVKRRPVTADDICKVMDLHLHETIKYIERMIQKKIIKRTIHEGQAFYEAAE